MTMSITRIFRVRIDSGFRQEFEELFSSVALHRIHEATGYISAAIHKPTKWNPDEYRNLRVKFVESFINHLANWDFAAKNFT